MEVNKEELRSMAEAATGGCWVREHDSLYFYEDGYTKHLMDADEGSDVGYANHANNLKYVAAANPAAILSLLDDLSQATLQCAKHGKALQEIGAALSLSAGSDLHKQCVPEIYRLFQSIGSGVTEAYKERMACQEVIDRLRAENERLRAQLAESQANDRTAMGYLAEVRAIVGGDDFPGMVRNVKVLRKDAERWYAAYENDVDLGMNGEEFVDWLVEKSKAPADI